MPDARLAGRLHKELKMLQDPPPGVCVWPADDHNLSRLEAQIQGPDGTVYSKGIFKLEVEIPDRYPFEPPNVKFMTPVYHPNIDSGGRICHDILNMPPKGQWRPSLNIGAVLASIRVLLEEPNHDDGLMSDISAEYKHNRALFDDKARRSTERYAMQNVAEKDAMFSHDADHEEAVACQSTTSKNQTQNFASKLSLAKGNVSQAVRSCSLEGTADADFISPVSFSTEKEKTCETEVSCGPGSQIGAAQPSELNIPSVENAGMEKFHEPENVAVELGRERSGRKDSDNIHRNDPVICNITKDKQLNTQTSTSQNRLRTSIPEKAKKLALPKAKILKLSRPLPLAFQSVQESTQTGRITLGPSHSKGAAHVSKDSVIVLDSESDDEDLEVQARSQGVKRKHARV